MATADEQVIVEGQRAVAVQQQDGPLLYSGGSTDIQCIVSTSAGPQRAIKVYNVDGWAPEGKTTAYLVQQLLMDKYQTQEVVDATDLVRNTAELNPFVLDLSSDTILKKLTATGTSEKVETGLHGVLVSNEAPFDSAVSPQIDVSYTGLNRTALQNLFNSMPYNVGYTAVGSPTITNGVASGFSTSDYLAVNSDFHTTSPFEMVLKLKYASATGTQYVLSATGLGMRVSGQTVVFFIQDEEQSTQNFTVTESAPLDTDFWVKVVYDGTNISTYLSTDGTTYTAGDTLAMSTYERATYLTLGRRGTNFTPFSGSIDLNGSYIKVNNILWFRGTAAMTKTISVVGCTGTADLTADDKAIAENKGWAITLS